MFDSLYLSLQSDLRIFSGRIPLSGENNGSTLTEVRDVNLKYMNKTDMNILKNFGVKYIKSNVYCFQIPLALISYQTASTFTARKITLQFFLITSHLILGAWNRGSGFTHTAFPATASFKYELPRRFSWSENMSKLFNNCPTRCDLFCLLYFCRQLYMFRVLTPIIRSSYNGSYSFWYWLTAMNKIRCN